MPATDRPVLIAGAAGQLGHTMVALLEQRWPVVAVTRKEVDLRDAPAVQRVVRAVAPWAIINCAGYNQVDRAEEDAAAALADNAFAVRTLARAAADAGATFVHYSSDFVFDGLAGEPYVETDRPEPQSVYAASKLMGEWFATLAPRHYVLRVESLFGGVTRGKSSLDRIIDTIDAGGPVRVFADRVVSPSYAWDVADATQMLLAWGAPVGLYHCVNSGSATWHELAVEARRLLTSHASLEPVSVADVSLPAKRPRYCALSNAKLRAAGYDMPTWQDALARAIARRAVPVTGHDTTE